MMTRTDLDSIRAHLADGTHLCPDQGHELAIELLEEVERSRMREADLASLLQAAREHREENEAEIERLREQRDRYNEDALRAQVEVARARPEVTRAQWDQDTSDVLIGAMPRQGKTAAAGPT